MERILSMIGLAKKAGLVEIGEEPVGDLCQQHKARVVFLANDAGDTICRRAARMAENGNAPLVTLPWNKAELGSALGRSTCAIAALSDQGLASAVLARLAQNDESLAGLAQSMSEKTQRQKVRRDLKKKQRAANKPVKP